jgi:hypothetical protein
LKQSGAFDSIPLQRRSPKWLPSTNSLDQGEHVYEQPEQFARSTAQDRNCVRFALLLGHRDRRRCATIRVKLGDVRRDIARGRESRDRYFPRSKREQRCIISNTPGQHGRANPKG